jgi:hypothetical protein
MRLKIFLTFFVFQLLLTIEIFAQNVQYNDTIVWQDAVPYGLEGENKRMCPYFEGAQFDYSINNLPFYYRSLESPKGSFATSINIINVSYQNLTDEEKSIIARDDVSDNFSPEIFNGLVRKVNHAYIKYYPFVKTASGQIQKISTLEYEVVYNKQQSYRTKSLVFANQSKLASGDWYKIATTHKSVYKLNRNFFNQLGIDVQSLDPRTIKVYGYGGGMLPARNNDPRLDDLNEQAVFVRGESDGEFDAGDFVAFYGESQVDWSYDSISGRFNHKVNMYSDSVFYFIQIGGSQGKRISVVNNDGLTANLQVSSYNDYDYHEVDKINLIKSGQLWLGEVFDNQLNYTFNFSFPGLDKQQPSFAEVQVVARAGVKSQFTVSSSGSSTVIENSRVVLNRYETPYATMSKNTLTFTPSNDNVSINLSYNKPQTVSKGWLNYININVRRSLINYGNQLFFRDLSSIGNANVSQFNIQSVQSLRVWDISDPLNITELTTERNANKISFKSPTPNLKEFVAFNKFDTTNVFPLGRVANQNLHGMPQADMLIVTHPSFTSQAERLANLHKDEGLTVNVATTTQVFNEFSSGAQDPIAIRMYAKMFYDRANTEAETPKYLLLFGDASYDFKNRFQGNTKLVVSYESPNSLQPVKSYVSDDYMALLDNSEGNWPNSGTLDKVDLGVGRLPVKTAQEAEGVLNKIIAHYSNASIGSWRNRITFVADDGDGNLHMGQSKDLANLVESKSEGFDLNKIFLDAYNRESTPAGPRYPTVNRAIDQAVLNGSLIMNYTGHGGETGWTGERVLDVPSILAWDNIHKQAIFVTATCEFSRFDDPFRTSAGELVLLNPNGGGIALLTTTRLVYANQNYWLNVSFYNRLLQRKPDGSFKRLGDVAREVKNNNAQQDNTRNFSLLGDPALKIGLPRYKVVTTHINNQDTSVVDTVNALSEVSVKGYLSDENGQKLESFNGLIYPTVFDKASQKKTLGNGGSVPMSYEVYESQIFRGKATVGNGEFEFKFIVPKDISYNFGKGRLTYFADNGYEAANGEFTNFLIGGSNDSAITDNSGPEIDLFLNDRSFVYGGITNDKPVLLADLSDELGLNTVGSGIGHDIIAIIDENTENTIVLNEYYEANVDDYKSGEIRFPLEQLSEGKHTLTLKAWDVANNSAEKSIEFNVVNEKDIEINNLVNYPNPFTTNTEFIFQHNQPGIPLDVKLEIFTVSGKLVKSFDQIIVNEGFLSRDIRWNGRDEYGDRIGKGVYIYKLKVRSGNGSTAEKIEKLVIL